MTHIQFIYESHWYSTGQIAVYAQHPWSNPLNHFTSHGFQAHIKRVSAHTALLPKATHSCLLCHLIPLHHSILVGSKIILLSKPCTTDRGITLYISVLLLNILRLCWALFLQFFRRPRCAAVPNLAPSGPVVLVCRPSKLNLLATGNHQRYNTVLWDRQYPQWSGKNRWPANQ